MSDVMQTDLLRIGGAGNFRIPARSVTGVNPVAGEEAGFQDFLWGFGCGAVAHSGCGLGFNSTGRKES